MTMLPRGRARGLALLLALLAAATTLAGCSGNDTGATSTTTGTAPPTSTTTTTEPPLEAGEQIYVYVPEVGDCFDRRKVPGQNNKQTDIVLKLDCALPHENEVFATVEFPVDPKDNTWPKDDALRTFGKMECPKRYAAYVGQAYELSKFDVGYVIPPEANWPSNHTVGCTVYNASGTKLVGTVKGSNS